jgi:hypothetical protein
MVINLQIAVANQAVRRLASLIVPRGIKCGVKIQDGLALRIFRSKWEQQPF